MVTKNFKSPIEDILEKEHKDILQECKIHGEEDGNRNMPSKDDDEIAPFEKGLLARYQSLQNRLIIEGRQRLDNIHDNEYKTAVSLSNSVTIGKVDNDLISVEADKNTKIREASDKHDDKKKDIYNDPSWRTISKDFTALQQRFQDISKKHGREELHISIHPYWAIAIIILIGFA